MATKIELIVDDDGTISYCSCMPLCKTVERLVKSLELQARIYDELQKEVNNAIQKSSTKKMDV